MSVTNYRELIDAAWEIRKCQNRMLKKWADSDSKVRQELWQQLHRSGDCLFESLQKHPKRPFRLAENQTHE